MLPHNKKLIFAIVTLAMLLSGCGGESSSDTAPINEDIERPVGEETLTPEPEEETQTPEKETPTGEETQTPEEEAPEEETQIPVGEEAQTPEPEEETPTSEETQTPEPEEETQTPEEETPTGEETQTPEEEAPEEETLISDVSYKDEPYFKYQWHLDSSTYETQNAIFKEALFEYIVGDIDKHADINITEAWKLSRGADVKVAVIDDGVDVLHEDIKDNLLLAYNVDDGNNDVSNKNDDPELESHGNTCAGFITASINSKGTVGVAPSSKLIAIKQEEADDIKTIAAFEYAKNNGAKVISCSWGTEQVSDAVVAELKSLYDAGITVLFASGNDGVSLDQNGINDESEVEWVIGVGASAENNDLASYSNYGSNIDVIAPGGDADESVGILGLNDSGPRGSKSNYGLVSEDYLFGMGTSYATPVVAGVVALMYSVNPNITPKQVKEILISTTDKVGGVKANYIKDSLSNETFDEKRAYGKINAGRAVAATRALKN